MTIVDPPIIDSSSFYKNKLYQESCAVDYDSSTTLYSKEESETTVYDGDSGKDIDLYSMKVVLLVNCCIPKLILP